MKSIIRQILVFALLIAGTLCDCPMIPYPRSTSTGTITVQINNDRELHGKYLEYNHALEQSFAQGVAVNIAFGVVGFQFEVDTYVNFNIENIPTTLVNILKFRARVVHQNAGWVSARFYFLASQNPLFSVETQTVNQFSAGPTKNKFVVFRPIANFGNFRSQPIIKIFISGVNMKAKQFDQQYRRMAAQYESFRKFSSNTKLIASFAQALQIKKSLSIKLTDPKYQDRLYSITIQTNCQLISLSFSSILFSRTFLTRIHNYIATDFTMTNKNLYRFTNLQNTGQLLLGINGFRVPRADHYFFSIDQTALNKQTSIQLNTNYKFMDLYFSAVGFEMKFGFVCADCPKSPVYYDRRFCVQECPRGFTIIDKGGMKVCEKCEIDKLMIVDPQSAQCVCAKRHFINLKQEFCRPCRYDCLTCEKADSCLTCDNNLLQTKRKLSNSGRCECPKLGYFDDRSAQNINCQKCHQSCLTCSGPNINDCLTCQNQREQDSNGFCVCKNGFIENQAGVCSCRSPRKLNENNICIDLSSSCGPNKVEQFVSQVRKCVCQKGYIQVLDDCIRCGKNSQFNKEKLKCQCVNQTILVQGTCQPCRKNQYYDSFSKTCICQNGSFRNSDGQCVICPPKMTLFNDKCFCIYNYYEASFGVCKQCRRESDGPNCRKNLF